MLQKTNAIAILLALLILAGMIVSPVCAWSQQWTDNTGTAAGHLHSSRAFSGLVFKNITKLNTDEITRIVWTGQEDWNNAWGGTAYTAATLSVPLYVGGSLVGNGTWYRGACTQGGGGAFTTDDTNELWITDFSTTATGQQTVQFYSNGWSNANIKGRYMHGTYNTNSAFPFSNAFSSAPIGDSQYPYSFQVTTYGGSAIIAADAGYLVTGFTCYSMGEAFSVHQAGYSGTEPMTRAWTLYDGETPLQTQEYSGESGIEHIFDAVWDPGTYGVQLDVNNAGGTDFVYISDFIHIGEAGECTYNATVNVTSQPTLPPVPTGVPNLINQTMWRAGCVGSALGNATEPYCDAVDMLADVTNGTFSGIIDIFTTPLDWMSGSVNTINSTVIVIASPLIGQSSLFLGMITRSLALLPAVLINIVTLGLAIDVIRIILRGKGGD